MAKVRGMERVIAHSAAHRSQFLMGQLQKVLQQPKFVHHLESGRMHGVASKIAKEVPVLLDHHHLDARSRQQVPQHYTRRTAAYDTAARSKRFHDALHSLRLAKRTRVTYLRGGQPVVSLSLIHI